MKYDLVVFDLDGTVLDTLEDLADAANHALTRFGLPERSADDIRRFIGNGVVRLIRQAVPAGTDEETRLGVLAEFKDYYSRHVDVHTRPYPGVTEMLTALEGRGIRSAVNSNKPDAAVQSLSASHFGSLISMALGERPGIPRKPAADGVNFILDTLGVSRDRTLYVGDGETDLLTAENAGIDCAWVSWGFRRRSELSGLDIPHAFDTAEALLRFIVEGRG